MKFKEIDIIDRIEIKRFFEFHLGRCQIINNEIYYEMNPNIFCHLPWPLIELIIEYFYIPCYSLQNSSIDEKYIQINDDDLKYLNFYGRHKYFWHINYPLNNEIQDTKELKKEIFLDRINKLENSNFNELLKYFLQMINIIKKINKEKS